MRGNNHETTYLVPGDFVPAILIRFTYLTETMNVTCEQ